MFVFSKSSKHPGDEGRKVGRRGEEYVLGQTRACSTQAEDLILSLPSIVHDFQNDHRAELKTGDAKTFIQWGCQNNNARYSP